MNNWIYLSTLPLEALTIGLGGLLASSMALILRCDHGVFHMMRGEGCCCLFWGHSVNFPLDDNLQLSPGLFKELQQWSLYEVIEDILPFVLNTKRPLSDIWLVSYKQNSFGCFLKKWKFWIFLKTPKTVLLISQQPNNAQKPFCIQNERQDILYHLI